jgi:hypothetical protein
MALKSHHVVFGRSNSSHPLIQLFGKIMACKIRILMKTLSRTSKLSSIVDPQNLELRMLMLSATRISSSSPRTSSLEEMCNLSAVAVPNSLPQSKRKRRMETMIMRAQRAVGSELSKHLRPTSMRRTWAT